MQPRITLDEIIAPVRTDLEQVERLLHDATHTVAPLIPDVGRHTLASGGKRVRPLIVLLAARLCRYEGPSAAAVASGVELLHTATLLHDDVVDSATTRRGQPSANARWGERVAILVGDYFYARASQTLIEVGNHDILWIFAETIRTMAEGEVLQLVRSFDPALRESVYLEVIGRKTSSLLAAAAEAGAILGAVSRAERRALREYGWQLGLAFQLVDDALDYRGEGSELGKTPLADLSEGKVTMPLLAALRRASVGEAEGVGSTLKGLALGNARGEPPDRAELAGIAAFVERHQGVEAALERARQCADEARARIAAFAENDAKRALEALSGFVVERTN